MALFSTLTDTFDTNTGLWTYGTQATLSGGAVHLAATAYDYKAAFYSVSSYDLTGSSFVFNISAIPSTANGDGPFFDVELYSGGVQGSGNRLAWHYDYNATAGYAPTWYARYITSAGATTNVGSVAFSLSTTGFLRIRQSGTQVFWDYSANGTTWTQLGAVTTPFTITALQAGFRASNNTADTGTWDITSVNPSTVTTPTTPTGLAVAVASSTQLNVSWTAVTGATSYILERSTTSSTTGFTTVATQAGTTYSDTGRTASTTYWYRVSASNSAGTSAASTAVSATTSAPSTAPVPTGLTLSASSTAVTASWNASTGATGYTLQRSSTSATSGFTSISTAQTGTTYTDTAVTAGAQYWYQVAAVNGAGTSAYSPVSTVTTPASGNVPYITETFDNYTQGAIWGAYNDGNTPTLSPATATGAQLWEVYYNATNSLTVYEASDLLGNAYLAYGVNQTGARVLMVGNSAPVAGPIDFTWDIRRMSAGATPGQDARFYWGYQAYAFYSLQLRRPDNTEGWALYNPLGVLVASGFEASTIGSNVQWRVVHDSTNTIKIYRNAVLISTQTNQPVRGGLVGFESDAGSQGRLYSFYSIVPSSSSTTPPLQTGKIESTLRDDFSSNTLASNWPSSSATQTSVTAGSAVLSLPVSSVAQAAILESGTHDITGSYVYAKITPLPSANPYETYMRINATATQAGAEIYFVPGAWVARVTAAGATQGSTLTLPLSGGLPATYWRIREANGLFYFGGSADATVWTEYGSIPYTWSATAVHVQFVANAWGATTAAATMQVDNVNTTAAVVVAQTAPDPVRSVSQTLVGTTVTVSWTAPFSPGNNNATIQSYTVTNGTLSTTVGGSATSASFANLSPGTYTFSVTAVNSAGLSSTATASSNSTVIAAPSTIPSAPTITAATSSSPGTATVTWSAPTTNAANVTSYEVTDSTGTTLPGGVVAAGTLTATITGLVGGSSYQFKVRAQSASGPGPFSALSSAVTIQTGAVVTPGLYTRSTLGVNNDGGDISTLEAAIGQAFQPVMTTLQLGTALDTAGINSAAAQGRYMLVRVGVSTQTLAGLLAGSYDAQITALGQAAQSTGRTVFFAPFYAGNEYVNPWSVGGTFGVTSAAQYVQAFQKFAIVMRTASPLARVVWSVSVETSSAVDQSWTGYYPGAAADVIMLKGFNWGTGPRVGTTTLETWKTHTAIFSSAYTSATALHASKPIWLYTACHDPSTVFTGTAGTVQADTAQSRSQWFAALLSDTGYTRVNAVVVNSANGERRWTLSSGDTDTLRVLKSTVTAPSNWQVTQVPSDVLADYARSSARAAASWCELGANAATNNNLYTRPDRQASGHRFSIVYGTPYTASGSVVAADMSNWNNVHGALLREVARDGMDSWALTSGVRDTADPMYMLGGTTVNSETVLNNSRDGIPGSVMQFAAGMSLPVSGTVTAPSAPPASLSTTAPSDTTTMASLTWGAPTTTGGTLTGYVFGYDVVGQVPTGYSSTWNSGTPVLSPPNPYVYANLAPGTTYDLWIAAQNSSTTTLGAKTTVRTKTGVTGTVVDPTKLPPSAPTGLTATNVASTTMTFSWQAAPDNGSAITGYSVGWRGSDGTVWNDFFYADPTLRTINLTGMAAGVTYTLRVYARNAGGDGAVATLSQKTVTAPAPQPLSGALPTITLGTYHGTHLATRYTDAALSKFNLFLHAFGHGGADGRITNVEHLDIAIKADLDALDAQGRKVVLSLGGAGDTTNIGTEANALNCYNSLLPYIDTYGFKGIDFDLEAAATYNANSLRYIAAKLKQRYGANFIVTCAPGPNNAEYEAFAATSTTGWTSTSGAVSYTGVLCDAIMPQFYDWRTTDAGRQQSMYDQVNKLIGMGVPTSRIMIGGAHPWGSYLFYGSPQYTDGGNAPQVFLDAYNVLKGQGKKIRGMFTWDSGHDQNPNNYMGRGSWTFRDTMSAGMT